MKETQERIRALVRVMREKADHHRARVYCDGPGHDPVVLAKAELYDELATLIEDTLL